MMTEWKRKAIINRCILGFSLTLVFVFFQVSCRQSNAYTSWYFTSVYSISQAHVIHELQPDGQIHVHESITYAMRKPYRMLYQVFEPGRYAEVTSMEIWTDGVEPQSILYPQKTPQYVEAEIWLTSYRSYQRLHPRDHPQVTLHIRYTLSKALEIGMDTMQLFPQFWGKGWDAPVSNLRYTLKYPSDFNLRDAFAHPQSNVIHSRDMDEDHNQIEIFIDSLPPRAYGEARILFEIPEHTLAHAAENPQLDWAGVVQEEKRYQSSVTGKERFPWMTLLIYGGVMMIVFLVYGKEPRIDYQGIYEREVPYQDSPALVNVIIDQHVKKPNHDGYGATIMNLYRLGAIDLKTEGESTVLILRPEEQVPSLPETEALLLETLKIASLDGVLDFEGFQDRLKSGDQSSRDLAMDYYRSMIQFESHLLKVARSRRFFSEKGSQIAFAIAFITMMIAFFTPSIMVGEDSPHLLDMAVGSAYLLWFSGLIVVLLPKTIFGRWTREGLLYYRRWSRFKAFLADFSSLSQHPPQSMAIWEEYLVYATALGIADQVNASLKRLVPRTQWIENSAHSQFYDTRISKMDRSFYRLRSAAKANRYESQSRGGRSSRGSGGSGRAGKGFGGRKGGAR